MIEKNVPVPTTAKQTFYTQKADQTSLSIELLQRKDPFTPPETLLGLYEGTPLPERTWAHGNTLPDKVTLFQNPIEDASGDEDDVIVAIGETLIHELGHYFGMSEEQIMDIEERYWSGEAFPPELDADDPNGQSS